MSGPYENPDLTLELCALEPDERAVKAGKFAAHFDDIENALDRGATKTKILSVLVKGGLSLSVNTFNKMLKLERARRAQRIQSNEPRPTDASESVITTRKEGEK
jgi:hypothetical protein